MFRAKSERAAVLLSGGLDSTTALAVAVEKYGSGNVIAITSAYGQRHSKEIECAKAIADYYKVKHFIVDLSKIMQYSNNALMGKSNKKVPEGTYESQQRGHEGPVATYVPYRNGLFLSAASAIALSIFDKPEEVITVYYGAHKDDSAHSAYPDTSRKFNRAQAKAIYEGSGKRVHLDSPFIGMNKAGVVNVGLKLKVPYEMTWSCYKGGDRACGICGTCVDRLKSFKKNHTIDPIKYMNDY